MGAVPPFVSPVNEPSTSIAGGYSDQWLVEVVRGLGRRIEQSGLPTRIVIPDDVDPGSALRKSTAVLDDPDARRYVAAIAYHLYGGQQADRQQLAALGQRFDVPVWMTEFSKTEWDSWPAVLEWATTVSRLLTEDGVSAVDYLWGFFGSQDRGHALISIEFQDGEYRSHAPTAAYWVTGQWSRFVRPGFVRVEATSDPHGAQVSAFVSADGRQLVVVAVNGGPGAIRVPIEVAGAGIVGDVRAIRSSATERWAELADPARQDRSFTAELVAESVTTFVVTLAS
jgi:O-glycosyl hydrolase